MELVLQRGAVSRIGWDDIQVGKRHHTVLINNKQLTERENGEIFCLCGD